MRLFFASIEYLDSSVAVFICNPRLDRFVLENLLAKPAKQLLHETLFANTFHQPVIVAAFPFVSNGMTLSVLGPARPCRTGFGFELAELQK